MCGNMAVIVLLALVVGVVVPAADTDAQIGELTVYQNLQEATSRVANLRSKPNLALIDANDGFFQSEVVIFKDVETGKEIWSLTREICTDLANIERRTAWSRNGQYISFVGSMAYKDLNTGKLRRRRWAGNSYIANADGSKRRKLWGEFEGRQRTFQDKFNNWDASRANVLYYPSGKHLWRITLGEGVTDNKAEPVHEFADDRSRIVQEVSDENFMLIEELGEKPNCYVVNLNRQPGDPYFVLTYPLKGMIHPGSFRFRRSQRIATGGYEHRVGLSGGERLTFADDTKLVPAGELPPIHITAGRRMHHLWYGPPDDRVGFFGNYRDVTGLYLQLPGKAPVLMADTPDGHVTWCSHDPDWFFAAVGPGSRHRESYSQPQYIHKLVACKSDGRTVEIICTPFDRRRGGKGGYDKYPRPNQSPDATKCWFHSSMLMPSDAFTGSYIAVFRRPYAPVKLDLEQAEKGVTLSWKLHELSYEVKGCHVYRSEYRSGPFVEITDGAVSGTGFADNTAKPGKTYSYAVTCEEWSRLESDVTSPVLIVRVDEGGAAETVTTGAPVSDWDTDPPKPVATFAAARGRDKLTRLNWAASGAKDLRHYNIYASSQARPDICQQRLLVSPPHGETDYIDWSAAKGKPAYYAITVVDRQGNESEPVFAEIE